MNPRRIVWMLLYAVSFLSFHAVLVIEQSQAKAAGITDNLELFFRYAFNTAVESPKHISKREHSPNLYSTENDYIGLFSDNIYLEEGQSLNCEDLIWISYSEWRDWARHKIAKSGEPTPPITWKEASSPVFLASYRPRKAQKSDLYARIELAVPKGEFEITDVIDMQNRSFRNEVVEAVLSIARLQHVPSDVLRNRAITHTRTLECEDLQIFSMEVR